MYRNTFCHRLLARILTILLATILWSAPGYSASSPEHSSTPLTARLLTAQNGVAPGARTISAGLLLDLNEGWKTYWKSPGEVGLPPEIRWEASENVADIRFLWPAPTRFRAFGIENFGYKTQVLYPLEVVLETPGVPTFLNIDVNLLVCSEVCVPENFTLNLQLGQDATTDAEASSLIAKYAARIPDDGRASGIRLTSAYLEPDSTALTLAIESDLRFKQGDVFPEMGLSTAFGPPDIRLGQNGRLLWARVPILSAGDDPDPLSVTITDGARAASFVPDLAAEPAPAPFETAKVAAPLRDLAWIALVAVLGGLILNAMPCVLPVLSIKLSSAMKLADAGAGRVRAGFLASAAGVMAFMWLLAGLTILARMAGASVGWGLQFQNPQFLVVMLGIVLLFAANMFGLFEINLPQSWNARLQSAGAGGGLAGDFATGAFAAVLATPCSAPFLGTAIAFALAGRPVDILVVFTALGLGLALPYILFAARPGWVSALPKPGRWMVALKWLLGALLALTAAWLIWVLRGVGGREAALAATALIAVAILLIPLPLRLPASLRAAVVVVLSGLALASPVFFVPDARTTANAQAEAIAWVPFDRGEIAQLISQGKVVFVDVTADWCLTCKANKALVIDRGEVAAMLGREGVVPMQADWTRPDETIRRYLEDNGRFGIPFNIVYGPQAPEGIALPEVLSTSAVLDAMAQAGADKVLAER